MFVAALPPDHVLDDLDDFLSVRRDADRGLRWTLPEQWHLTLAFLPAVPDRVLDDLLERLTRAARKRAPMTAALVGGGAFPNPGRAKVLWAGVDVDDPIELDRLATGCRTAATKAGVEVPGERFKPHLTLARWRESRPPDRERALKAAPHGVIARARIDGATLYQSRLSSSGPAYTALAHAPLRREAIKK